MVSLLLLNGTKNIISKILKLKPKYDQLECILDSAYKWEKVMKKLKTLKG